MPKISVLVAHYNNALFLKDAISSLLNQTYQDLDIYLLDDCSTDNWLDSIDALRNDARLKVFRSTKNVGHYRLKNKILSDIDSEFIAIHDSDDISLPDRFEKQLAHIQKTGVELVGSSFQSINAQGDRQTIHRMPKIPQLARWLGRGFLTLHPTWLLRRKVFETLKGFDGHAVVAADDEFFLRFSLLYRSRNVDEVLYLKRIHPNALTEHPDTGFGSKIRDEYTELMLNRIGALKRQGKKQRLAQIGAELNDDGFELERI